MQQTMGQLPYIRNELFHMSKPKWLNFASLSDSCSREIHEA